MSPTTAVNILIDAEIKLGSAHIDDGARAVRTERMKLQSVMSVRACQDPLGPDTKAESVRRQMTEAMRVLEMWERYL